MAELTLLSIPIATVREANKCGDIDQTFANQWAETPENACLICDAQIHGPPATSMFLPDLTRRGWLVVAPLCPPCSALPPMVRLNRATKMLRAIWSRRGRQVHF